jgi:hypothetical protein
MCIHALIVTIFINLSFLFDCIQDLEICKIIEGYSFPDLLTMVCGLYGKEFWSWLESALHFEVEN